MHGVMT